MPRKKKQEAKIASAVPEHVLQARTYGRKRVTKRQLPSFEEAMFLLHVPELAREYFKSILEGLRRGDKVALEHAGEMLSYVQRKGININVAQQMMAQSVTAGDTAPVKGFDSLVREISESRGLPAQIAAPSPVLDIHPVENVTVGS